MSAGDGEAPDEQALRVALRHVSSYVALVDDEGTLLWLNRAAKGREPEEIVGRNLSDFLVAESLAQARGALREAFATGTRQAYEAVSHPEPGREIWLSVEVVPLEGGDAPRALLVSTDHTDTFEAEAAERERREYERRLELAMRASKVSFWEWWPEEDRVQTSDILRGHTDLQRSTQLDEFLAELFDEDRDMVRARLGAVRNGRTDSFEAEYRVLAEPSMWFMGRGAVVARDAEGRATRLLGCTMDITRRKDLESVADQLHHAQRLESIGQLAGGVAHDFNNLLQVLQADLAMLQMRLGDEASEELDSAQAAVARAGELTSHLLTYARRQPHAPRTVRLDEVLRRTLRLLERLVPENVTISVPDELRALSAFADVGQVEQVLTNLCVNARDAMPAGGRIEVTLEEEPREGQPMCVLTVRDEGPGFSPDALARGAEPFFTTKAAGEGTGLGLSVVLGIAERHEGFLELGNHADGGGVVRVGFPVSREPETQLAEHARSWPVPFEGRVLLVEDDAAVRRVTSRALRRIGLTVLGASNADEALTLSRNEDLDVAVIDVRIPGMSGIELARVLSRERPQLPVVMVSGYAEESLPADWLRERGIRLLHKPFGLGQLLDAVREAQKAPK